MFENYDIIGSGAGLVVSVLGLDAGGVLSYISAIAAATHAVFFLGMLIVRAFIAFRKWRGGKITDDEFIDELTNITEDVNDVTKRD